MAYSRWSKDSIWYTYWSAVSIDSTYKWPTKELKYSQVFEICDTPSYRFTYGLLQSKGMYMIMRDIRKFYSSDHKQKFFIKLNENGQPEYEETIVGAKNPTSEQMLELLSYIREWERDVEEHFKFWTFIKYEWWYPIRNKFKIKLFKK
jgi:hypothetical protein